MKNNTLNASEMKSLNQKKILNILHSNPCSRADLARLTGLSRAAITIITDKLAEMQYVIEGEPILGKVGRKSFVLKLNPDIYHIIGINISRKTYSLGIFDFCGNLLFHTDENLCQTPQKTLEQIADTLSHVLAESSFSGDLLGIGITAPGPLDVENGRILNPPNFGLWAFINIADYFNEIFHCPVVLENNSNALALAEKAFGAGKHLSSFVELNIDSGIGSGVILNEKLYQGSSGFGNDFGHMSINYSGEPCHCGNIGCAELYASIPNILKFASISGCSYNSWKEIVDDAYLNEPRAAAVFEKEAGFLSLIITNIVNILDVDTIIITGDVAYRSELLLKQLRILVNQRILARVIKQVSIESTGITEHAEIISSANLMFEYFIEHVSCMESLI